MSGDRPAWVRVLIALYTSDRLFGRWSPAESVVHPDDPIHDEVDLDERELSTVVESLRRQGLLKQSNGRLELTERGFEVAQRHYIDATDADSSTVDSEFLSLGILILGLFTLVAMLSGPLGLTSTALTFLIAVAVGVVVGVTALAFGSGDLIIRTREEDYSTTEIETTETRELTADRSPDVSSPAIDQSESSTNTSEDDDHSYQREHTEDPDTEHEHVGKD